jgi:hypothetical protein
MVPLTVALTIYTLIILLFAFRTLVNYAKWIFPVVELKNGSSFSHRAILGAIILGLIIAAGYDIIKVIIRLFF